MTAVYSVQHPYGIDYYPTKREAMSAARVHRKDAEAEGTEADIYVSRSTVTDKLGRRELFCALLNGTGWAEGRDTEII
jgi:hypothetical protein